ncbi:MULTISPECIES: M48 family metallopeptidase [Niastella]|uniref:M48 family metallopeptidase n=1 Tax=Niastella soli TaxID=2821487 RepID=A0ABS3YS49_9BACT|nr:SprT family zinc-dependent metalloprotease [Niastella soli]MBO9200608.1 M48 family metallopeptidase [Niastella soli]
MKQSEGLHIEYGTTRIPFVLSYGRRRTLGITVTPDKQVTITAPYDASLEKILEKVGKRAGWISKQIRRFESYEAMLLRRKIEFVSGETLYYIGRKYRLKVLEGSPEVISREGRYIKAIVKSKTNQKQLANLIMDWYKREAKIIFQERFERCEYILKREKISFNQLLVRRLEKRWGSCTELGNITLNLSLIQAPVQCIDYVIVHELCHLKHLHHGPKFYGMLSRYMEDWEKRKNRLQTVRIFE